MKKILLAKVFAFASVVAFGQTPSDAIMMKQWQACVALNYERGSWDHYWEGDYLRTNENVNTLQRQSVMTMIAFGVHDKVNVIVSLPWVSTGSKEIAGGYQHGQKGLQDLGFVVKGELFKKELGAGKFSTLAVGGVSTPIGNYLSDYMPYSIGFGAPELSLRGIAQYRMNFGLYALLGGAHLWRGQTEIERDYYYNNGSYYTNKMDVPNAWNYNGALGMWFLKNTLKVEATYLALKSTSGDDIRKYNAGQPTNKVEFAQVGANAQYFIGQVKKVSVLGYYNTITSGRNMGQFTTFGLGVTYQFKVKESNATQQ